MSISCSYKVEMCFSRPCALSLRHSDEEEIKEKKRLDYNNTQRQNMAIISTQIVIVPFILPPLGQFFLVTCQLLHHTHLLTCAPGPRLHLNPTPTSAFCLRPYVLYLSAYCLHPHRWLTSPQHYPRAVLPTLAFKSEAEPFE